MYCQPLQVRGPFEGMGVFNQRCSGSIHSHRKAFLTLAAVAGFVASTVLINQIASASPDALSSLVSGVDLCGRAGSRHGMLMPMRYLLDESLDSGEPGPVSCGRRSPGGDREAGHGGKMR